jgi:histidine triad (HIT) family protein
MVARAVKSAFSAPGIMVAQLNGEAAGQSVFHLHFHVMPRFGGLDLSMQARDMEDFGKLEAFAERIRTEIA